MRARTHRMRSPHERIARSLVALGAVAGLGLTAAPAASGADSVYWSNFGTDSLAWVALDGSNAGSVGTAGASFNNPIGVAIDAAAGRIYWANGGPTDQISYANLTGGGGGDLVTTGASPLDQPQGVAIDPAAGRIYWANNPGAGTDHISFANLNGSGGGDLVTTGATVSNPEGVALDPAAGRLYWANSSGNKISFANLNGSGGGDLVTTGATVNNPIGVAIDGAAGRIYWANGGGNKISFASLNGSGGGDLVTTGATVSNPYGVAIDPGAGRIYWVNIVGNKVSYANLNGSGGADLSTLAAPLSQPAFLALLKAPVGAGAPAISGDSTTGSTLSCSVGAWAADLLGAFLYRVPQSFAFQWLREGSEVAGATGATIVAATPGQYACRVTAQNQAGASSQTSAALTVADAPPTTPPTTPPVDNNNFQVAKTTLNKRKGTATIAVIVPGPGELTLSGKNVATQKAPARAASPLRARPVVAGTTVLTVKATGKARKKLKRQGKVKVNVTITFTPSGGNPSVQSRPIKLKKTG